MFIKFKLAKVDKDVVININQIIAIEESGVEGRSLIRVNARTKDGINKSYIVNSNIDDVADFIYKNSRD